MVQSVRAGRSLRSVAAAFGVSVGTVFAWVERAHGKRIDRFVFANRKPGRAWNRTAVKLEQRIVGVRSRLREKSVLGEFGADAIGLALRQDPRIEQIPARATINRVPTRCGALAHVHASPRVDQTRKHHKSAIPNSNRGGDTPESLETRGNAGLRPADTQ